MKKILSIFTIFGIATGALSALNVIQPTTSSGPLSSLGNVSSSGNLQQKTITLLTAGTTAAQLQNFTKKLTIPATLNTFLGGGAKVLVTTNNKVSFTLSGPSGTYNNVTNGSVLTGLTPGDYTISNVGATGGLAQFGLKTLQKSVTVTFTIKS